LAVLAVLYIRRRTNPSSPEVSLMEVEVRMGFPRDYLEFTTWYLQKKGYITRADNSAFTLTAEGVDFVETQRANIPVLSKLLTSSSGPSAADSTAANSVSVSAHKPANNLRHRSFSRSDAQIPRTGAQDNVGLVSKIRTVSGHDFSRAEKYRKTKGFSP